MDSNEEYSTFLFLSQIQLNSFIANGKVHCLNFIRRNLHREYNRSSYSVLSLVCWCQLITRTVIRTFYIYAFYHQNKLICCRINRIDIYNISMSYCSTDRIIKCIYLNGCKFCSFYIFIHYFIILTNSSWIKYPLQSRS